MTFLYKWGKEMNIQDDLRQLTETLKQQRDEIALKVHLASMEAKDEWENAEKNWDKLSAKASEIYDETVETTEDMVDAAKVIGDELADAYRRIKERL